MTDYYDLEEMRMSDPFRYFDLCRVRGISPIIDNANEYEYETYLADHPEDLEDRTQPEMEIRKPTIAQLTELSLGELRTMLHELRLDDNYDPAADCRTNDARRKAYAQHIHRHLD